MKKVQKINTINALGLTYIAVQRRLWILVYTLWKRNEEYDPGKFKVPPCAINRVVFISGSLSLSKVIL